jgi:hypothetical protein
MSTRKDKVIIINYGDYKSIIVCLSMAFAFTIIMGAQSGYLKSALIWFGAVIVWYVLYCEKYSFYEDHMDIYSIWRPMKIQYCDILKINKAYVRYAYNLVLKENVKVGILHSDFFNNLKSKQAAERIRKYVEHNNSLKRTSR